MFSVVVPLYNRRPYIRKCIDSVLAQTFRDFELIVVDDGSTDGGIDAITDIDDCRLRVIQQSNAGRGFARNTGIFNANHPWIAFLDADDFWFSDHLEELQRVVKQHPEVKLISSRIHTINADKEISSLLDRSGTIREIDYFLEASKFLGIVTASSCAVEREAALKTNGFKGFKAGEDLEFWSRIALDHRVAISSKITAVYVRGTGGITDTNDAQRKTRCSQRDYTNFKLQDLSPSVSLLACYLTEKKDTQKRKSIVAYINSRVYSGVCAMLYDRNLREAKLVSKLFLFTSEPRIFFFLGFMKLPLSFINSSAFKGLNPRL